MGVAENPVTGSFILVICAGLAVMVLSFLLTRMWVGITKSPTILLCIFGPGIVMHECAHAVGCVVTGARIKKIVFLSSDGGKVIHTDPAIPVLGNVIISTAPLFVLPFALAVITWFFGTYAGCSFQPVETGGGLSLPLQSILSFAVGTISTNLFTKLNFWFFLYLYLVVSLALSFSPSARDLTNAAIGIMALLSAGTICLAADIQAINSVFLTILGFVGTAFFLAAGFEIIALLASLPVFLAFYVVRQPDRS